jgi:hypothetical protein
LFFQTTACKKKVSTVIFVWNKVHALPNPWHSATWLNKYLERCKWRQLSRVETFKKLFDISTLEDDANTLFRKVGHL